MNAAEGEPAGPDGEGPHRFAVLLLPRFALISFANLVETLRAVNDHSGRACYDWTLIGLTPGAVQASSGVSVATDLDFRTDAVDARFDTAVVCGGLDSAGVDDARAIAWLRAQARAGARVGGIADGPYLLARAGLLDNHSAALHWQYHDAFIERYPRLSVTRDLYNIEPRIFTVTGGVAILDAMLRLVEQDQGPGAAMAAAEKYLHDRPREGDDQQPVSIRLRVGGHQPKLRDAVALMEDHLEDVLPPADIARLVGLSVRQLERLFRAHLGMAPTDYYRMLRLRRARQLLRQTDLRVAEVAAACGFASSSNFSKRYRSAFHQLPQEERRGRF